MILHSENIIWDLIVIGGGPAGMMAAGRAAERGKSVLLLEKNASLGKKLLITGGGRCNLTNNKLEKEILVSSYKGSPKPLFSLFSEFDVNDTIKFFHSHYMETKLEEEGRIFPLSNKAISVWDTLNNYINSQKVNIRLNSSVLDLSFNIEQKLFNIKLIDLELISRSCIVATGGTSHPETGSSGDGFKWLKGLGHSIVDNSFALVPIAIKDAWIKSLSGLTLDKVGISIFQDKKRFISKKGRLLFTHFGITGPTILNLSSKIGDLLNYGEVDIELDLFPDLDFLQLKMQVNNLLAQEINKKIKNTLVKLIPTALVLNILRISKINEDKVNHSVTREEKGNLIKLLKAIPLKVKSLLGADKAIVSSGGVKIEEINFKTMQSRIIPNLFIVGDLLNIDRPSGGYSLQLCWSSGFVAGNSCLT